MLNADILREVYGYLAAQPGLPPILYRDDTDTRDGDYITPHWMPAKTLSPVISEGGHTEQRGLFQIDCVAKAGYDAELRLAGYVDAVSAALPRALVLDKLQIVGAPTVMPVRNDGGYGVQSVSVEYVILDRV